MSLRSTFAILALASIAVAPLSAAAQEDKARSYTRAELEKIIEDTLMEKPEIIINAVERMQVKQQAEQEERARQVIQAYRTSLKTDKDSPVVGPKDADVTVVEFFDYNCGYCKRSLPNVAKLLERDKKVNIIFKEYPVLAPSSEEAARASLAMYYLNPDKYFDYHSALFRLGGKFDEVNLTGVAEGMGVDADDFKEMMDSERVTKHIKDTQELAAKMGARGVPVFIIGDEMFPGAITYEAMKRQVDLVRERQKTEKAG